MTGPVFLLGVLIAGLAFWRFLAWASGLDMPTPPERSRSVSPTGRPPVPTAPTGTTFTPADPVWSSQDEAGWFTDGCRWCGCLDGGHYPVLSRSFEWQDCPEQVTA